MQEPQFRSAPLIQRVQRRVMLWAFDRLYHEFAWTYDLVAAAVSGGAWQHWITAVVPWLKGRDVLELGCGTGYLQVALARADVPHVGVDLSSQMLRRAQRRLRSTRVDSKLVRGRGEALAFSDARFSDVVATFPAPYILTQTTLGEIRRVLRSDGQLLIVDGGRAFDAPISPPEGQDWASARHRPDSDNPYTIALRAADFAVEIQQIRVGRTMVSLIRATK